MPALEFADLQRILDDAAGSPEGGWGGRGETDPFDEIGYDSLALLEMVSHIERDYDIEIPEEDVASLKSPVEVMAYVNQRLLGV